MKQKSSLLFCTMPLRNSLLSLLLVFFFVAAPAQGITTPENTPHPLRAKDAKAQKEWVDELYESMSLEEKIGQLFMISVSSNQPTKETEHIKSLIRTYHIGGIIFSKGGPERQAKLTNEFQTITDTQLLIGQDAEWGLAMRLDSTYAFPWNMTLGAIENNKLIEVTGAQIAKHAKRLGVHLNFAPDVDININPDNPIIGNRSFGANKKNVTQKAAAFAKGMENEGVMASIKHFPGHGDTDVDSHKDLPVLDFSKDRLDSIELYPYRKIIPQGVSSVLVGHLSVPALDGQKNRPSSLSKPIINGLLKDELNFKGLITTDALDMKGVANPNDPGQTSLDAFLAGNDLLLMPPDLIKGIKKITQAYNQGQVTEKRLEHSVKKILMAKYKMGLNKYKQVNMTFLHEDLNALVNDFIYGQLMEEAITVIKNQNEILPIKDLDNKEIAYVPLGDADGDDFYNMLQKYDKVDKVTDSTITGLLNKLEDYNQVILGFHKSNKNPWAEYKFSAEEQDWVQKIAEQHHTILNVFARPYALLDLKEFSDLDGIVIAYQNSKIAQEKTAQIVFGGLGAKGKLPVSLGEDFPEGTQIKTKNTDRLSYGIPEEVGVNSSKLKKIDSIAEYAVSKEMTPGLQVSVARKEKVIFQKNYGYHTYSEKLPVKDEDVFDLASMTKILGALPLYMELVDRDEIDLDMKLEEVLPFLENSNKADISLKEALSHYGRFTPFITFYKATLNEEEKPSSDYYRTKKDSIFNVKVADDLFLREDYKDSIYKAIADSDLLEKKEYVYSDFPFYLSKKLFEDYYETDLHELTQNHFYQSLGANYMGYLPLSRFSRNNIMPTEVDDYFRMQPVHGYVHDEGAAMLGGDSGHAGLFSNANDVLKMLQLYLNGGTYGGKRYFSQKTMDAFNTCYFCAEDVLRGIGFDKPQAEGKPGPSSKYAPESSYGHTGFTGTKGWVDPEKELIHVVLSNYVHPDRARRSFITEDIRIKIEDAIYEALKD